MLRRGDIYHSLNEVVGAHFLASVETNPPVGLLFLGRIGFSTLNILPTTSVTRPLVEFSRVIRLLRK